MRDWESPTSDKEVIANIGEFKGDFVAQNVRVKDDAMFDYKFRTPGLQRGRGPRLQALHDQDRRRRPRGRDRPGISLHPIANPQRFIPDWTFGINDADMQKVRGPGPLQGEAGRRRRHLAQRDGRGPQDGGAGVGHRRDLRRPHPRRRAAPTVVKNAGGQTLVTNAGSNGKFLGVMDLDVKDGKVSRLPLRLLPVFSNLLPADAEMQAYITQVAGAYKASSRSSWRRRKSSSTGAATSTAPSTR